MTTPVSLFYKQVDTFKQKLHQILLQLGHTEECVQLDRYYDKLLLAKRANARLPIQMFHQYGVKVYASQILDRDEHFFLDKSHPSNLEEAVESDDLLFVGFIRDLWPDLSEQTRENIWKYVQVICVLADRVMGESYMVRS